MNDDIDGKLKEPNPEPLVSKRRAHTLISLYSVFGDTVNFRNPGGAMYLRHYASELSYVDAIWKLNDRGYVTRLECDLSGIEDGFEVARLLAAAKVVLPGNYWTAFITSSAVSNRKPTNPNVDDGRILRLVFAFLNEADAMMLKLKIPPEARSTFRLTKDEPVLS